MEWKYNGQAFKQSHEPDTPWLVSLVVPAEELLDWAAIPNRTDHAVHQFQRVADPLRVEKAKAFFKDPSNQSPTSLIVGIHQTVDGEDPAVQLTFTDDAENSLVRSVELTVTLPDDLDLATALPMIRARLDARLADDQHDESEDEQDGDETDYSDEDIDEDIDDPPESEGIEVGHSVLRKLRERLEDDEWVQEAATELISMAKPATIIDGQHRVLGGAACEEDLPFSVIAMHDCAWGEQVFQFTVVNYTSQGIPDQFITANAALSLTEAELGDLQSRLAQAGVKVIEYDLMRVVHFDPDSPFFELVNLAESTKHDRIGYKTMVRVAKAWYGARNDFFRTLFAQIYSDIEGRGKISARKRAWQDDLWGLFFKDFWTVVHGRYSGHDSHVDGETLWTVGSSQLMIAAVLEALQQAFLENLDLQDESLFELSDESLSRDERVEALREVLKERAEKFVDWIPPALFQVEWKTTSLNTGAGKLALASVFTEQIKKKGKYQFDKSSLVRGQ